MQNCSKRWRSDEDKISLVVFCLPGVRRGTGAPCSSWWRCCFSAFSVLTGKYSGKRQSHAFWHKLHDLHSDARSSQGRASDLIRTTSSDATGRGGKKLRKHKKLCVKVVIQIGFLCIRCIIDLIHIRTCAGTYVQCLHVCSLVSEWCRVRATVT